MRFRAIAATILGLILCLLSWLLPAPALALTNLKLLNLSYKDCPPELAEGNVTSGGSSLPATCYMVTGQVKNDSGKTVYDADVFGRIYDADNEPIMQNRARLGAIDEISPGVSDFELRISVPSNQSTPLKLDKFKASGFTAKVVPTF